jgi:hypothetical protein
MPLAINSAKEIARTIPLVAGRATVVPVAINPSMERLQQMGVACSEEPKYLIEPSGKPAKRILSIWMGGLVNAFNPNSQKMEQVKVLGELKLFIPLTTGQVYIDNSGRYGKDKAKLDQATARVAYSQEWKLIELLKAYGRVGYKDECYLEKIHELVADGNVTELEAEFNTCHQAGHKVTVFFGVEQNQYQVISDRAFLADNTSNYNRAYEELRKGFDPSNTYMEKAYYGPIYHNSSTLQVANATNLALYREEDALVFEEESQKRNAIKLAAATQQGIPQPGNGAAPAAYPGAAPAAAVYSTENDFPTQNQNPNLRAQPAPIASDDDNDLPF